LQTFKFVGKRLDVKRLTILILGLFSTSPVHAAAANVVSFTCDYELGAETNAKRTRIGSVAVRIDVKNKSARIDFGNGWFRTNALQIDGTHIKEKAPPKSGKDLGFFYFDLKENSGGFSGSGNPEFFDACVQTASVPAVPDDTQASATKPNKKPDNKRPPTKPAAAPEKAPPPRTFGQATTEYYGSAKSRTKPAWAAEAAMNPNYKLETAPSTAAPRAVSKAVPPQPGGKAAIEYFGDAASRAKPAWAAEATMNPDYNKSTLPTADTSTTSPAATPQPEASIEACRLALSTAAEAANLSFANASFVVESRSKAGLRKIAKIVNDCGNVLVEVGGHTDSYGDPDDNKALSQLRANAVADFLIGEGVAPTRLKAVGYGQEQPVATNKTLEGRRLNRRVEFRVSGR
jgi:outer membrane protein OmpA-like peptidoglycan-associated protein